MKKLDVTELILVNSEPMENTKEIILHFSAKSLLLYEQHSKSKFFNDYQKAMKSIDMKAFSDIQLKAESLAEDAENANIEDLTQTMELMMTLSANADVNDFLMTAIPAMYAEISQGKFLQNEITFNTARESDWLLQLLNANTLFLLLDEINGQGMQVQSEAQPKKKAK